MAAGKPGRSSLCGRGRGTGGGVRRGTRVVGAFPDGRSARVPACGRWRYGGVATRGRLARSVDIGHLDEREGEKDAHRVERA